MFNMLQLTDAFYIVLVIIVVTLVVVGVSNNGEINDNGCLSRKRGKPVDKQVNIKWASLILSTIQ